MKKKVLFVLLLFFIFPLSCHAKSLGISASSAVVMAVQTGEVLYEYDAYTRRSMASTTKIMTALLALENGDMNREIKVSPDILKVEGTSMGLVGGDIVTVKGLVYGMLLQSGNDAANVTANVIGGNVENFVSMMNNRAKAIGMNNTNFVTPSGLDDEKHYSTAYDMALLGCEAMKNADFRFISSQQHATLCYGNPPYRRTLTNHNKMLYYYDDCIGIKTGFTKKSGRCLVSAAEKNGVILVAVTLNAPNDWSDHKKMLDYGFSLVEKRELVCDTVGRDVKVVGGNKKSVPLTPQFLPYATVNNGMNGISCDYLIKKVVYAPVNKGDILGKIVYSVDGRIIEEVPLVAFNSVKKTEVKQNNRLNLWQKIKNWFADRFS